MTAWNPIHRYTGLTSQLDGDALTGGETSARYDGWGQDDPQPETRRAPVGFGDVRAEASTPGGGDEPPAPEQPADVTKLPVGFAASEPDPDPAAPPESAPEEEAAVFSIRAADAPAEEKVPFYKREISFGRKKHAAVETGPAPAETAPAPVEIASAVHADLPEDEPAEAPAAPPEKVPFYKREISFRRGAGEPRATAPAEPVEPPAGATVTPIEPAPEPEPVPAPAAELEPIEWPAPEQEPEVGTEEPSEELELVHAVDVSAYDDTAAHLDLDEHVAELEPVHAVVAPEPVAAPSVHEIPPVLARNDAPVAEPYSEPELPAVEEEPVVQEEPAAQEPTAPLHKRELGLGGKGKGRSKNKGKQTKSGRRSGKTVVGLKIGASQLAAAVIHDNDGRHELVELARTPLEPGIVLDGEVRDADALVAALRGFFSEQKLPTKDVRIGIASNRIGVRTFDISGVEDGARFDNAVRFKAHEVLPIGVSDSVLDYRVLDERLSDQGELWRRILLVVAPRDQVAPYVDVVQRAGLKLAGVDLEALALLRAFVEPHSTRAAGDTSTVVVSIGHEATTLLVSGGGLCEFTRVFDWGGSTLQDAIAQELQVHPTEAATILRHLSLTGQSRRVEGVDEEAKSRALDAVRLRLTPFARELVSSLQFYQTQPDSLGIGEIVITGGTSQLDGLADSLHQMIGVQVRVGDPMQRVFVRKGVDAGFEGSLGSLAVAIGLAIDDDPGRSVDLTPRDAVRSAHRISVPRLAPVLVPVGMAVPLVAVGLLWNGAHGKVSDRQSQLSSLQAQYAALPVPKEPTIDSGLQTAEAARASAVAQVLGVRTQWDGVLRDLSRVIPANVWLTSLRASVPNGLSTAASAGPVPPTASTPATPTPVAAAPTGVTVVGTALSQRDVAILLGRLVALRSLENVQLQSSAVAPAIAGKPVIQFTILANMRQSGGGA